MSTQKNRGNWIQTFSGIQFYPLDPRPEDIDIEDIGHGLSNICRYGGQVDKFYSVAEHCFLMSHAVPRRFALEALLHDAAEAYVGDMVRPLKMMMPDFQRAEDKILQVIFKKFSVLTALQTNTSVVSLSRAVKEADSRILLDERNALMRNTKHPWDVEELEPLGVRVMPLSPTGARNAYLARFEELTS